MMNNTELLHSLRRSGLYSDLTIVCGDEVIKAHKNVVCMRSDWFKTACEEGKWKEGTQSVIDLEPIDPSSDREDYSCDYPQAVGYMLDFIYTANYDWEPSREPTEVSPRTSILASDYQNRAQTAAKKPIEAAEKAIFGYLKHWPIGNLTTHARVYAMATKYQVKGLKDKAVAKMQDALDSEWGLHEFANAITITYNSTPEDDKTMRAIMRGAILKHSKAISSVPLISKTIQAVDGLGYELFRQQSYGYGNNSYY